jgi:hypothetical protein
MKKALSIVLLMFAFLFVQQIYAQQSPAKKDTGKNAKETVKVKTESKAGKECAKKPGEKCAKCKKECGGKCKSDSTAACKEKNLQETKKVEKKEKGVK